MEAQSKKEIKSPIKMAMSKSSGKLSDEQKMAVIKKASAMLGK